MNTTTVSFPGLGIGEISFSRVAFPLFGKDIYWYGIIICVGFIAAFLHAYWRSKEERVKADDLLDLAIYIILFGVLGARLYYVLTTLDTGNYHSFVDVIAVWEGGLAIYGGIIAGGLAIVGVCFVKKMNILRVMDMVGPGVMIAQAIGRWANFINGEAFGEPVTEGHPLYFLRMNVCSSFTHGKMVEACQPTFLYESLWNVLGFVLITVFYRKKKFHGQNAFAYLAWYGFGRMFIEGLRTDSLYIGNTGIRISQLVGFLCFIIAGGLWVAGLVMAKMGKLGGIFGGKLVVCAAGEGTDAPETSEAEPSEEAPSPEETDPSDTNSESNVENSESEEQ